MTNDYKNILVFADWSGIHGPKLMGTLFCNKLRGKEIYQFEYSKGWLQSKFGFYLDPGLQLFQGRQFPKSSTGNFGLFLDSMPDRWGRQLMMRREAINAKAENRKPIHFDNSDFLLGVDDYQRLGALRFKLTKDGPFLNNDPEFKTPPWSLLRDLEFASLQYESDRFQKNPENLKWFKLLVDPASSLGGARPKAGVKDPSGCLWIGKFPSKNDDINVGAWEMVINQICRKAGIRVPEAKAIRLSSNHHTYLSKRFDRDCQNNRFHFASAMTMLEHQDGDDFTTGASYLEMVPFILKFGCNPKLDLEELWKRIMLSILIKNTDDHLRNHGFLLDKKGWSLSPAYDININPNGLGLKLNIDEFNNDLDINLGFSIAEQFRVSQENAKTIFRQIEKSIRAIPAIAGDLNIDKHEIEYMIDVLSIKL